MNKKTLGIFFGILFVFLPMAGEAQITGINTAPQPPVGDNSIPSLPLTDVVNLINQITSKVVQGGQALQNLAGTATGVSQTVTTQTSQSVGSSYDISGLIGFWNSVNNWFTQNVGTSLSDVVKTVVNFMIYIWEIIIKLLQVLVAHL
jgi:hypothetical protein